MLCTFRDTKLLCARHVNAHYVRCRSAFSDAVHCCLCVIIRVRRSERAKARDWSEVGFRDRARAKDRSGGIQVGSPRILGDETGVIYIESQIGDEIERRVIRGSKT